MKRGAAGRPARGATRLGHLGARSHVPDGLGLVSGVGASAQTREENGKRERKERDIICDDRNG